MKIKLLLIISIFLVISGCKFNEKKQERVEINYKVQVFEEKNTGQENNDTDKKIFNTRLSEPEAEPIVVKRKPVRINIIDIVE
jgi:hypothetical protein